MRISKFYENDKKDRLPMKNKVKVRNLIRIQYAHVYNTDKKQNLINNI